MKKFSSDEWKKLQENFLTIAQKKIEQMREAFSSENFSLIQHYAHQLKGSGSSYGFPEITEISGEIERKCALNLCNEVGELIFKLYALVEKLKLGIK